MSKLTVHKTTLGAAIDDALQGMQELGQELQDWADNMPENMQGGDKHDELENAASDIGNIPDSLDVPEFLAGVEITYSLHGRARSRNDRRNEYVSMLQAVVDKLDELIEAESAKAEENRQQGKADEMEALQGDVQDALDEAEAVEFPGR